MNQIKFNKKLITSSKVICIGRNYVEHIKELDNEIPKNMVIFNKPNSSITSTLYYFSPTHRYEGELCFLVRDKKIVGIGFGLDLTNKEAQEYAKKKGLPWERAKSFNNSAVFSEFVEFKGEFKNLHFKLWINGELKQEGSYDLMIYKPNSILKEIQSFMSLENGDIIMSGTPKGVGTYQVGDKFIGQIYSDDELLLETHFIVKDYKEES